MAEEMEVAAPAPAPEVVDEGEMDITKALQEVLKKALIHDGLLRGLRECAKALDRGEAQLCVLASDCDEPAYTRLVEALCAERGINLVKVPEKMQLGEWAGLAKVDEQGIVTKSVKASCVVVKDFGEQSKGLDFLKEYLREQAE
ncbi:40S ribosomal protein S12 [Porphyridium purpureum]|uniref:40S ribosomal protein S12 n=1 Tax=Porphyridium purpureum TaxID=35688 RepID=A0A5J4Z5L5_PORPP|nr:40S ribosomal protein S12 [Porphyridium purpureum]|eukprot:POR5142..scf295_1